MSIIEKKVNNLATLDLSPITFNIPTLKEANNELDYLKAQLEEYNKVRENNIKLAMQVKELRDKYVQEKKEHKKTKQLMHKYFQAENTLNIVDMYCPYLKKEITLVDCNHSTLNGYCGEDKLATCSTRINNILKHYKIPSE